MEFYINRLASEGSFKAEGIDEKRQWVWDRLGESFEAMEHSTLKAVAENVSSVPEGFELHPNLERFLGARLSSFEKGSVGWATAESLAFGTLCLGGHSVRLTGQDVQRGTFSQRYSVLHSQATGETWTPLSNLAPNQAAFQAINSLLSEFGALGFEYGVTLADPNPLVVMWEAQFGGFANNTQVIIDNFTAEGESKWLDRSGVVLSLPHGYDGQGAEHSSARLERFLLMCNEDGRNWPTDEAIKRAHQDSKMEIVYMTSPANYFHVLRHQMKREYHKRKYITSTLVVYPGLLSALIMLFSNSLLHQPFTKSNISELSNPSATFQPILVDPKHTTGLIDSPESINRVIFCIGQLYATLMNHRTANIIRDTAIIRIEELHPSPGAK
ncbi:Fc.00g026660.m01.CDS01 [Cosmosporella sp. VM-42]